MVPCAFLRVFQPLEAFSRDEQAQWERYIVQGSAGAGSLRFQDAPAGGGFGFLLPTGEEGADVKLLQGTYYVCPWRMRMRVLAGLLAYREAAPPELRRVLVPDREARRATRELARLRRRDPNAISFVMQSLWHVPIRWFVLVEDDDRRIEERLGRYRLRYLTSVRKAIRRAERSIPALRRADLGPVADLIVELHEWLARFHRRSLLELDYGSLCDLFTWDELDDDHSARDVHAALRALSSEEFPRSAELYQSVIGRWAEIRAHESTN